MVPPPAFATAEATRAQAAAPHGFAAGAYRMLGRTGLTASALGFGGYRVDDKNPAHRQSLEQALAAGISLIDTSSNYTDGASERMIGRVFAADAAVRERVVLVSKVGYVQGQNLQLAHDAQQRGKPFAEMVEYHPQCWHCIHPGFLADQLERSLARLALPALDIYLLHNPEYFFSDWLQRSPRGDLANARETFYARCTAAFAELENQVKQGRISWYGVSSNTFGNPSDDAEAVSLERLVECARNAAGGEESRFAVVQCPMNVMEPGPALEPNQSGGRTFLDVARAENLGVLVNRPLNAIRNPHLTRLADHLAPRPDHAEQVGVALDDLAALEADFAETYRPQVAGALPDDAGPHEPFDWSSAFRSVLPQVDSVEGWMQMLHGQAFPHIQQAIQIVSRELKDDSQRDRFRRWVQAYAMGLENVSRAMQEHASGAEYERSADLRRRLSGLVPEAWRNQSLSQMALRTLLDVPGVTCVLNGMRRAEYVRDSLGALGAPPSGGDGGLAILRSWA